MIKANSRTADYPIDSLFLQRWSSRAFTAEPIAQDELFTLLEAARWAPSAYNSQPWRFLYALRDTEYWRLFQGFLSASNQTWAQNAAALVILVSKTTLLPPGADDEIPSLSHSFDAGAAWASLALQATRRGWVTHAIGGLDRERAASELEVPTDYRVEVAIAIGRPADKSVLPAALQAREVPSTRLPLSQLAREGSFAG